MASTPPEPTTGAPADHARLQEELQAVREQALTELESGDDVTGREYLGLVVGGLLTPIGLIMTLAGLSALDEPDAAAVLVVGGLLALTAAFFGLRRTVRRRVRMARAVRDLRRRESALMAQLPAGSTGPGLWNQYYTRRFGSVYLAGALFAGGLVVLLAVVFGR